MQYFDCLIVGGSVSGITAALELKAAGHRVAVLTHRSYLGEDVCDSLRLAVPGDTDLSDPLTRRLFGPAVDSGICLRPMHLKHELDRVLIEADIPALLCAVPTGVSLQDGRYCLDLQTRSGSRTLFCHRLLDATLRGELGRLAGIPLTSPTPEVSVTRRVVGGEAEKDKQWIQEGEVEYLSGKETVRSVLWACTTSTALKDGRWSSWMQMEQDVRCTAYRLGQEQSADGIEAWTGERLHPGQDPVDAQGRPKMIPAGAALVCDGSFAFSGPVVNVDEKTRSALLRPDGAVAWGRRVAEHLQQSSSIAAPLPDAEIPSLDVDVLVIGGGTGGAPAAIGAARAGATTLVAEVLSGLGGVGTLGMIGRYWFGNRVGFTAEVDAGSDARTLHKVDDGWDIEAKMQWYHEQISQAGGHIWYKTSLSEVLTDGDRVVGAVLATPQGPVRVHSKCVVDATGSGEVAAHAGAETVPVGQDSLALQGTGLPSRSPGQHYHNTDYDFIDDTNEKDTASAHITARQKFKTDFDAGQHIDSRERRRIVGDIEVTPMDIRLGRIFPDTIVKARSNFDTHGYTLHPLFMIVPPDHDPIEAFIPLRALLPKGLDGVIVTGLGISAHRDAMPVIRMQADVQNQGYAAGVIAARCPEGCVRNLDVSSLQAHLVDKGILDPEIRDAEDSFPLPEAEIRNALEKAPESPEYIDRIFTLPEEERHHRLREVYHGAKENTVRRFYAFVLGILEDATGVQDLREEVETTPWDKGWNYTGMGQFGASMSPLDSRIIALGRCRDSKAVPVLTQKAATLPDGAEFSHIRALTDAFTSLADPEAIPALEHILNRHGVRGHALLTQSDRDATATDDSCETSFRNRSLIELHLATALVRLDPANTPGCDVLQTYTGDVRGLFARHAKEALACRS